MSGPDAGLSQRAAELRHAFDSGFADPHRAAGAGSVDALELSLGGDLHAVLVSEIAGLFSEVRITPMPGSVAGFCGIAGLRGGLLPVYDLGALLGRPASGAIRWALLAAAGPVALGFERLVGHRRLTPGQVADAPDALSGHIRRIARTENGDRPLIDIPSVVAAIRTMVRAA